MIYSLEEIKISINDLKDTLLDAKSKNNLECLRRYGLNEKEIQYQRNSCGQINKISILEYTADNGVRLENIEYFPLVDNNKYFSNEITLMFDVYNECEDLYLTETSEDEVEEYYKKALSGYIYNLYIINEEYMDYCVFMQEIYNNKNIIEDFLMGYELKNLYKAYLECMS
ncbi:hypothetical protein [Lachnospira multipara]|uniref:Uncharacterized protein n=1 Tax=Lachnospira multipara TaxID=28051 RepID=A0A1H5VTJ2_9FIRM|nr:hypothetical protein [Lachnospira multipara]SEF90463.1 hypothetical protein SAMN05216537_11283 [Lachnospira multipara]